MYVKQLIWYKKKIHTITHTFLHTRACMWNNLFDTKRKYNYTHIYTHTCMYVKQLIWYKKKIHTITYTFIHICACMWKNLFDTKRKYTQLHTHLYRHMHVCETTYLIQKENIVGIRIRHTSRDTCWQEEGNSNIPSCSTNQQMVVRSHDNMTVFKLACSDDGYCGINPIEILHLEKYLNIFGFSCRNLRWSVTRLQRVVSRSSEFSLSEHSCPSYVIRWVQQRLT